MTLLVDDQYSIALLTPDPGLMGSPAEIMAISAPKRYEPTMISSLLPRCPILNTLPATSDRPTPRDKLYRL